MKFIQLFIILFFTTISTAQIPVSLEVTPFTDFDFENIEPANNYDFGYPVYADILSQDPNSYEPEYSNRYFMSIFGGRHKEVPHSNIGFYDFHQGSDMTAEVTYENQVYDDNNPPEIHCVCDGEIYDIFTGPNPEGTNTGMFVTVKCDSTFNGNSEWGNIYTAYRHLDSIEEGLEEGDTISKGDVVGLMGSSGHTTKVHLHFSVIRRDEGHQINVHPMRIFNPEDIPHLVDHLTNAEITQLYYNSSEALFRIAVPYNMTNIRAIQVSLPNDAYNKIYDLEEVCQLPEEERDSNSVVDGLELFAYPFNRGQSSYVRVWDRYEEEEITADFPASPDRGAGNFYPFLSEGLLQTPAYVMDLKVKNLPQNYNIEDLNIKIIDIWGYGMEANGAVQANDEHFAWAMIANENDDSEEYENGTINLSDHDLELVYDYSDHGNQTVGLLFRDLDIPNSATVTNAFLQFRADASHSGVTNLKIKAEDAGNANDYTNNDHDLSNRDTTYQSAFWQAPPWIIGEMNGDQKWTGLKNVVQEVVTHEDWTSDSPLSFIITGTGRREAEGYSGNDLWKNAYLYVEYNDEIAGPPNEAPSITLTSPIDGDLYDEPALITLSANASDPDNNLDIVHFYVNDNLVGSVSNDPFELEWDIPDFGVYTIHAIAYDSEGLFTSSEEATINVVDNVIAIQIAEGDDDVEELENGTIWKRNSDLELCYDNYVSGTQGLVGHQHIGLRFQEVNIPHGATITNAYVQFTADETDDEATQIIIRGEASDNASSFSYATNDVSDRNMTSDSITWNPPAWNIIGEANANQRTPPLNELIQSIVDREGWTLGNSMVLIFYSWDEFKRVAESYNGSAPDAPVLHIEYSTAPSANQIIQPINPSSIKKAVIARDAIRVAPNPVYNDRFSVTVHTEIENPIHLEVTDIFGRRMDSKVMLPNSDNRLFFETKDWAPGMYLVNLISKNEILSSEKIILPN